MIEGYKIVVEYDMDLEDQTIEGTLIDTSRLNKIARAGKALTYQMNIMDEQNKVYMWFTDETNENYFTEIKL